YRDRLRLLQSSPALTQPDRLVREMRQRIDELMQRAEAITVASAERQRHRLKLAAAKLDSLSPLSTLARGYAICTRASTDEIVRDAGSVRHGERLLIRVENGSIPARVTLRSQS